MLAVLAALSLSACGERMDGTVDERVPSALVRVAIDQSDPERLLRYYFGGYVSPRPADPFEAGILSERAGRLYVDRETLDEHHPGASDALADVDGDGTIRWEEFEAFIDRSYHAARSAPDSVAEWFDEAGFEAGDADWMHVEVDGVMTTARRHVYVRKADVRAALEQFDDRGGQLAYPIGTTFFGRHVVEGRLVETTIMHKRADDQWDFFVYDADGGIADSTSTPPRALKSPVQCVGCHFGDKLLEPERSFPGTVRPGPHGPRALYVDDELRDAVVVRYFDEHRRRSDDVLGLYGTLFVSRLRAERRAGTISDTDAALLDSLLL
ncbi:MAG: hypothetical protein WD423_14325 [Rhodothermales bacterium]